MSDKSHFSLSAAEYEVARGGHLELRRLELIEEALRKQPKAIERVLEIGFGSGKILAELAHKYPRIKFIGTEIEKKMVAYAQEHYALPNVEYILIDMARDTLDQKFDYVYSIDVLHHIHERVPFLRNVRTSMNEASQWLIIEPNVYHPYIHYQQDRMRRRGLDEDQFRPWIFAPLFRDSGLTIRARRYAFLFPGFIQRIPRLLQWLEYRFERYRFAGGSVMYLLIANTVQSRPSNAPPS